MHLSELRNIAVLQFAIFLFAFCVLEQTGFSLLSQLSEKWYTLQTEDNDLPQDPGNNEQEQEPKETSYKYQLALVCSLLNAPLRTAKLVQFPQHNTSAFHSFHPPVPTPPPDAIS